MKFSSCPLVLVHGAAVCLYRAVDAWDLHVLLSLYLELLLLAHEGLVAQLQIMAGHVALVVTWLLMQVRKKPSLRVAVFHHVAVPLVLAIQTPLVLILDIHAVSVCIHRALRDQLVPCLDTLAIATKF